MVNSSCLVARWFINKGHLHFMSRNAKPILSLSAPADLQSRLSRSKVVNLLSCRLKLGDFIAPVNSSESSGDFLKMHHGGNFYTRDSDKYAVNCARLYGTAFWFRGCWAAVNLNGPYITVDESNSGVRWATSNPNEVRRVWKTEMMIRPVLRRRTRG